MQPATPDPAPRRPRPAVRHLAAACRAHAEPVYLQTGRYAPPNAVAVWHLVTPADNVLVVTAYQGDREICLRIAPAFHFPEVA